MSNTVTASSNESVSQTSDSQSGNNITTCNHRNDEWLNNLDKYSAARGWVKPDRACVSDVYLHGLRDELKEMYKLSTDDAFEAVDTHASNLNATASEAIAAWRNNPDFSNALQSWNSSANNYKPYGTRPTNFSFSVRDQRCKYNHAGFIRRGLFWYIAETLTNSPQDVVKQDGRRELLHEYVRMGRKDEPAGDPLEVFARQLDTFGEDPGDYVRGTTTVREFDKGSVTASTFGRELPRENLAVIEALRSGEHQTQQASDATTPSNIAIMAFPLVMNAVPVALIADVNTIGMLTYTLLTDVLTAVPLAIKGVEVLDIGRRVNRAVVVRVTGGNLPEPGEEFNAANEPITKAAEVWVAQCRATGSLRAQGITLLVVALAFMVGGIIAEVWARDYVKKRKKIQLANSAAAVAMVSRPENDGNNQQLHTMTSAESGVGAGGHPAQTPVGSVLNVGDTTQTPDASTNAMPSSNSGLAGVVASDTMRDSRRPRSSHGNKEE